MKAIDIDVGGTFTDLVLTWDDARYVAKAPTTPYDLSVGFLDVLTAGAEQLGRPLDQVLPEVEIVRPSGYVLRVRSPEANAQTFRYADTHDAGVYLLRLTGTASPRQFAFAVNMEPEECDPAVTTAEELKGRFGKHPFVVCENPDDVAGTIHRLREGKSLWEVFLAAVLAGLVLEAFLANRVAGRPAGPTPEGRSAPAAATR